MADIYESWVIGRMPRWLRGVVGDRFHSVVFGLFDAALQAAKDAADIGLVEKAPEDAVDYHGAMRLMERLPWESIEAFRLRLLGAWDHWTGVANTAGLRDVLRLYLNFDGVYIYDIVNDDWLVGYSGSPTFGDDNNADNASRHFVIIDTDSSPYTFPEVGEELIVGPGLVVGTTMTGDELRRLRGAYRLHRPANMVGGDIYVLYASNAASTLGDHDDAGTNMVRIPLHRQMVGYIHHGMTVGPTMVVGQEFT